MNELTLPGITKYFRKNYPKATKVIFSIGYHGFNVSVENHFIHQNIFQPEEEKYIIDDDLGG